MANMETDVSQKLSERFFPDIAIESRMPHAGPDGKLSTVRDEAIEALDIVNVNEVRRQRNTKRHGRHETLTASNNTAVDRSNLSEYGDGVAYGARRVVVKLRRLHRRRPIGRVPIAHKK